MKNYNAPYDPVSQKNHLKPAIWLYVGALLVLAVILLSFGGVKLPADDVLPAGPAPAQVSPAVQDEQPADEQPADEQPGDNDFTRYAYSLLNDEEKELYTVISEAVGEMGSLEHYEYTGEMDALEKVITSVFADYPEYFWFVGGYSSSYTTAADGVTKDLSMWFDYMLTEQERQESEEEIYKKCKAVADSLSGLPDYEKSKGVYEYLAENVVYDLEYKKGDSLYFAMTAGRGVCGGYARAAQYIFNLMGMDCVFIFNDVHSWNAVKLDGEYYYFDATWGDDDEYNMINYAYLNIDDELLNGMEDHYLMEDLIDWPACSAEADNYFVREDLLVTSFDKDRLGELVRRAYDEGEINISFADSDIYKQSTEWIFDEDGMEEILANLGSYTYVPWLDEKVNTLVLKFIEA